LLSLTTTLGFVLPSRNIQFRSQIMDGIIASGIITVVITITWLLGYPIGRIFVLYKAEDTTVLHTHPVVINFIQLTSGVMFCTFFFNFILSIAAKVCYDREEKETASLAMLVGHIAFAGMIICIPFYGFYFNTNIEKIAANYEKEINKWMDYKKNHPNNHDVNDEHEMINILETGINDSR
jgi:hypothetical protein